MVAESLATSAGTNMEDLKIIGFYLNIVRDKQVIPESNIAATQMADVDEAIDALKSHASSLRLTMRPMEESSQTPIRAPLRLQRWSQGVQESFMSFHDLFQ